MTPPRWFFLILLFQALAIPRSGPSFSDLALSVRPDGKEVITMQDRGLVYIAPDAQSIVGDDEEEEQGEKEGEAKNTDDPDARSQQAHALERHEIAASVHQLAEGSVVLPMRIASNPAAGGIVAEEAEIKEATKLAFFAATISIGSLVGILSGYIGDQTGRSHSYIVKLCAAFMMASLASASSLLCMIYFRRPPFHIDLRALRVAELMSMGSLFSAAFVASLPFLEGYAALAAIIPVVLLMALSFLLAARM